MWMSHDIWTSHVTHINESGVCRLWIIKHIVSCEWVMWMSHVIWTSHVTHINESGVCRLWVMTHIMSYEWVMTHTYEWVRHPSPASHDTHHVSMRVACLYAGSVCRLWVMTPIVNIVLYAKIMIHAPRIKLNLIIFSYLNTQVQNNKTGGLKGGGEQVPK